MPRQERVWGLGCRLKGSGLSLLLGHATIGRLGVSFFCKVNLQLAAWHWPRLGSMGLGVLGAHQGEVQASGSFLLALVKGDD